jgi:N-acetyl-anhydromuramyl-L-alanine amidase AmpD
VIKFRIPTRTIKRVFIHCSASDNPEHDDISVIRKWHTSPDPKDPTKPWRDVGYHFYIKKDGTIQKGRDLAIVPSAQAGHNTGTIAICCGGLADFPARQMNALVELCDYLNESIPNVTFHGHREVAPHKSCPVFNYKEVLLLDDKGRMEP